MKRKTLPLSPINIAVVSQLYHADKYPLLRSFSHALTHTLSLSLFPRHSHPTSLIILSHK